MTPYQKLSLLHSANSVTPKYKADLFSINKSDNNLQISKEDIF